MTKTAARRTTLSVLAVAVLVQLVPITRDNPPVRASISVPPAVDRILRRACYDCHSAETAWPWYGYVAPASWLVAHDVHDGRRHLNFSDWTDRAPKQQEKLLDLADEVKESEMPPWYYVQMHPEARLSQDDIDALVGWAESTSAQLAGKP